MMNQRKLGQQNMRLKKQIKSNGDWNLLSKSSNYFNVYRISLLAIMTALTAVGRLAFALPFMPNIQPMTALLIIIALNIGIVDSLIVSLLSILLTNLFFGVGPWSVLPVFCV